MINITSEEQFNKNSSDIELIGFQGTLGDISYGFIPICFIVLFTFNKINSSIDVFYFRNVFIYVEELNYTKDYMKVMRKARGNYVEN